MKEFNWKNIKKIVGEFQETKEVQDDGESSFYPVFVHANQKPALAHPKMLSAVPNVESIDFFYYLIYLAEIRKNNALSHFLVKAFVSISTAEEINLIEEKTFQPHQRAELVALVSVPNRMFYLEDQDLEVLTFTNKKAKQEDFEHQIELWRRTFQTKS